jgi:hypothetical protein
MSLTNKLRHLFGRARQQSALEQPQNGFWKPMREDCVEPFKDVKQVSRTLDGDIFVLDSGREVSLLECHIERSALGWLCGRMDEIRADVIRDLPERVQRRFPERHFFINPIPNGDLLVYLFMVSLSSSTVGTDLGSDSSRLVVCWFANHIDANLVELIGRGIRCVDWEKYAENWLH